MVAADNDVRASEVLSNDGVKHCLARTCVAHLTVEPTEQRSLRWIIALEESFVRFELCPLREVSRLLPADDRVHEQSVYKRQRQLLEVLVRAVRHVARVERRHRVPAALGEQLAGLARPVEVLPVLDLGLAQQRQRAAHACVGLGRRPVHTRMRSFGGPEHGLSVLRLHQGEDRLDPQQGERPPGLPRPAGRPASSAWP